MTQIPVYFHPQQLLHKPLYEWAFGERIAHPETTHRAESILNELRRWPHLYHFEQPEDFPANEIAGIHNPKLLKVLQASAELAEGQTFSPSVFPYTRDNKNIDPSNLKHAGAFCFDSGTPLTRYTYPAAIWSAASAMHAARAVHTGNSQIAYGLCRPPGHHATKDLFGGYCYFNNAALAANWLSSLGRKVAILDIDFHHGNGSQSLFYESSAVFVANIHGNPNQFYPYLTGYRSETGRGAGKGFNLNLPLASGTSGDEFLAVLTGHILDAIGGFQADILVLSAGFDTSIDDPIGAFSLQKDDFQRIGQALQSLKIPMVVIQEGGYHEESLGRNVQALLSGLSQAFN